ncbi:MAG: four helix bundle protein [Fimbriimonadales bacterium]
MFVSKLTRAAGEGAETQNWLDYAVGCRYIPPEDGQGLSGTYDAILRTLHGMITHSDRWCRKTVGSKNQSSGISHQASDLPEDA